MTNKKYTT